ncbi:ATP-binding protein [Actinoplanes sp. TRM 88003]|uniref:ATP-binding protein n=1 Tax=Paractinoplanes aksuensis TaxID=2939490 RepID=A0ABT1E1W3_9ACTN|nr:AAA family ATPase [Actinoplanes aksuensis]MCO8276823.1 ATP-binding protein [Actinoplanes aksuensis]
MLIRFEASNFRSLAENVELSMVAVDRDRDEARPAPLLGESLVTVAAIYGPNASGKSNVVAAFTWLRDAILLSLRAWEDEIPIEPFAFGDSADDNSVFVLELLIDGVRFEYLLELDRERVYYEALFHYPERKRRRIFERDDLELKLQRGLGGLSGTRELLTPTTLALSVARRFEEPLVSQFARELARAEVFGLQRRSRYSGAGFGPTRSSIASRATMRWFEDSVDQLPLFGDQSERDQALALLQLADLGISDVVVDEEEMVYSSSPRERSSRKRVRLVHKAGTRDVPLNFELESEGTKTWFHMIGPVLNALRDGSIIVFDELDASLHPTVSAELLKFFHSPTLNPRGAQLVFTSHDTSLLNHLNRDEVWLTEKRDDGSTRLGALAEFAGERVRRSQNLESAYLHGRFGALPQVDQSDFLRAVGLIG